MYWFNGFRHDPPKNFQNILQFLIYKSLNELQIPYDITKEVSFGSAGGPLLTEDEADMRVARTAFWEGNGPDRLYLSLAWDDLTAETLSAALGVSLLRPASPQTSLDVLDTEPPLQTALSLFLDSAKSVAVVMDRRLLVQEYLAFRDGTEEGFLKIRTSDLLDRLLPATGQDVFPVDIE